MRKGILFLAAGLLALAACSAGGEGGAGATPAQSAASASAAEEAQTLFGDFTATDLDGGEATGDIFSDHDLTMVNVWATFCGPCINEMPFLGELNTENAEKGFQIVGVVLDVLNQDGSINAAQVDTAKEIVEKTGASYRHLLPSEDLYLGRLQEVSAVPTTYFVDSAGNLVGEPILGGQEKADWQAEIDRRLEKVGGAA